MTTTSFVFIEAKMWYPESMYLLNVRERFCERLTVTVSWRVTRELIVQQHPSHILFTEWLGGTVFLATGCLTLGTCGLRLTHQCSSLVTALLSVLPQQCVTVCCHRLHQHCQSRHFTLVKFGVLWLFENPIVWEWSCLVSCHHLRRHCWLQTISLITLGGLQLVAAKVEREWLYHDGLPCVRVLLGGGVEREGQNTLVLVEG